MYVIPPDVADVVSVGGDPVTVATGTPGQNAEVTFDAADGDRVSMLFTSSYGTGDLDVKVTAPSGATVWSTTCIGSTGFFDAKTFTETGTYTIALNPNGANTGASTITPNDVE